MKQAKLGKTTIDIPIIDEGNQEKLVLRFDKSDANIKRLNKSLDKMKNEAKSFEGTDDFEPRKEFLKEVINGTFEDDPFEKLYEISPSLINVTSCFVQVAQILKEELEKDSLAEVENKYLS